MNVHQQHLLDTWHAARLAEPAPPPPGRHDVRTLRELYRHWLSGPAGRRPGGSGRPG